MYSLENIYKIKLRKSDSYGNVQSVDLYLLSIYVKSVRWLLTGVIAIQLRFFFFYLAYYNLKTIRETELYIRVFKWVFLSLA